MRLLCRDEVALIEERTALINQLQQALYEYYPAALEAFDDWTLPAAWAFVEKFPTPPDLVKVGKRGGRSSSTPIDSTVRRPTPNGLKSSSTLPSLPCERRSPAPRVDSPWLEFAYCVPSKARLRPIAQR